MKRIAINSTVFIFDDELQEKFIRSSGPGGQNVNKVSTAVQLRFDVKNSPNLPQKVKDKLLSSGDKRLTKDGELVIIAESKRTQEANRRDAITRLVAVLREATFTPRARIATRPTKASVKRRLDSKAKQGMTKRNRSKPSEYD